MRLTTFASGSGGNCALVSAGDTHILVDAGISMRRIVAGLRCIGHAPADLAGVIVTHAHSDHVGGLANMVKHHHIAIYAPRTVANDLRRTIAGVEDCLHIIVPGEEFSLGSVRLRAFPTSHDAPESVGYRLESEEAALGFCTDLGCVTGTVLEALSGVDAAVIEANHDVDMLLGGPYPYHLKRRILSERGHLSNEAAAGLAVYLAKNGANQLVLAHLSRENNTPTLAMQAVCTALAEAAVAPRVSVAPAMEFCTVTVERRTDSCLA